MPINYQQSLTDQCQLIQDDLDCILNGIDDNGRIFGLVCKVIVDRFKILKTEYELEKRQ